MIVNIMTDSIKEGVELLLNKPIEDVVSKDLNLVKNITINTILIDSILCFWILE